MIDEVFETAQTMNNEYCDTDILLAIRDICVERFYKIMGWVIANIEYIELWCIFIIILALYDLFSYYQAIKTEYKTTIQLHKEKIERKIRKLEKFEKMVDRDLDILFDTIEALHTEIAEKKSLDTAPL